MPPDAARKRITIYPPTSDTIILKRAATAQSGKLFRNGHGGIATVAQASAGDRTWKWEWGMAGPAPAGKLK